MRSISVLLCALTLVSACGDGSAPDDAAVATSYLSDQASIFLDDGASVTLTGRVLDQHGQVMPRARPTWRSLDTSVVAVDASGRVTARHPGITDILAIVRDSTRPVHVFVRRIAAALSVSSGSGQSGIAEVALGDPVVMRVSDRHGDPVLGEIVRFATGSGSFSPEWVTTGADGIARTSWTPGPGAGLQSATAHVDGIAPASLAATTTTVSAPLLALLQGLEAQIASSIETLRDLRPRNPGLVSYIDAKLAMLEQPGLRAAILRDRRWIEGSVTSTSGRAIPIVAAFPLEPLRGETAQSVQAIATAMPVLETFMATPFPTSDVRVWEGFVMGNSGGGGSLFMEDRATYESRTPATRLPYDAILVHEVSHSYIGNESLDQLLELYQYNVVHTGSRDVAAWTFTRGWVPGLEANTGVHALLDVYQLVGADAMARAYRAIYPLRPPYGQPLSAQVRQAFVDQAPEAVKAQVAAKMEKVTT